MIQPPPYVSVSDALAGLLAQVGPVAPRVLSPGDAQGFTLAEPLASRSDLPVQPLALRDGWAVASDEVVGASGYSPISLAQPPRRITIGQALPPGADAVLPLEAVTEIGGVAEVTEGAAPGEGTRRPGEDARAAAVLRESGRKVRGLDAAVAAAAGIGTCLVRQPSLRLLGSNAPATALLAGLAAQFGAVVERVATSEAAELRREGADLAVIVGPGAAVMSERGEAGSVVAARVALRPGEGAGCAVLGPMPVLWCPARLETVLALALALLKPCIERLAGTLEPPSGLDARLTRKVSSGVGFAEIALLRHTTGGLEPLAAADLTLAAIAAADAWLIVPPESEGFAAGETVFAFAL